VTIINKRKITSETKENKERFLFWLTKTEGKQEEHCCQSLGSPLTALPKGLKGFREANPEPEMLSKVTHLKRGPTLNEVEETT